jgi:thiamine-monophosphate kinase
MQAAAAAYNVDPREWMLTGGEDHALLATFPGPGPPDGVRGGRGAEGEPGVLVDGAAYLGPGVSTTT